MTKALAGSAVLHAHSFNGFLHADRLLRAVDRFDLIAVQQATKPFCAQRGASLPGILTLVLRVLFCLVRLESCWRHHVLVVCRT